MLHLYLSVGTSLTVHLPRAYHTYHGSIARVYTGMGREHACLWQQVIIDLERNCLVFGGAGGIEVAFLEASEERPQYRSLPELGCPVQ